MNTTLADILAVFAICLAAGIGLTIGGIGSAITIGYCFDRHCGSLAKRCPKCGRILDDATPAN